MKDKRLIKFFLQEFANDSNILDTIKQNPLAYNQFQEMCETLGMSEDQAIQTIKYLLRDKEIVNNLIEDIAEPESIGDLAEEVWEKGTELEDYDPDVFRLDACGALICKIDYDKPLSIVGWKECMIVPKSMGGDNRIENLRPLHISNITSKGNNYPTYQASMTYNGDRNVASVRQITISKIKQEELNSIYGIVRNDLH